MDMQRRGTEFYLDFDKKEDIQGLYAVLNNRPDMVDKATYEKGMMLYGWIFKEITTLFQAYEAEASTGDRKRRRKSGSSEDEVQEDPVPTTRKRRKGK